MSAGNGILLLEGLLHVMLRYWVICWEMCVIRSVVLFGFWEMLCCGHFMAIRRIRYPVTVDWEEHFQDVQSVECS